MTWNRDVIGQRDVFCIYREMRFTAGPAIGSVRIHYGFKLTWTRPRSRVMVLGVWVPSIAVEYVRLPKACRSKRVGVISNPPFTESVVSLAQDRALNPKRTCCFKASAVPRVEREEIQTPFNPGFDL